LKAVCFKGSNAVAIDPNSFTDSGFASSSGMVELFSGVGMSTLPQTIKRESSADDIFAAESRRSITLLGARSLSTDGPVNAASWLPLIRIPSVYERWRRNTIVGFGSFQRAEIPCPWATDDSVAPLSGSPTDLKNAIHGSR